MAASAIAISSDSLDESVGSPPSRVILFGDIPSTSVVAPETIISSAPPVVETTLVASPTGLCGLVPYSGSDSDSPDEIAIPLQEYFILSNSSEAPDSSNGPPSQDPYVATFARWRSRVTARPLSSSKFPIALFTALPAIRRRSAILIRPREDIPFGQPYCTHLNGSQSSSGDSSERPMHSSSHSAGPSRKRCRSPVDSVPSSTPVMGSLVPTRADLLPPHKRFRDSYSSKASIEEDTEINPIETKVDMELEEYEADTSGGDTVEVGIDPMSAPIVEEEIVELAGEDSSNSSDTRDGIVRSFEDMLIHLNDAVREFYHYMSKVCIDRIVGIETVQRWLEADQLIAMGERAGMIERIESLRLENFKVRAILDIERDRVNSLRLHMSFSQEEFRQVCRDRDDTRGRLRRLESYVERQLGFRPKTSSTMIM
ncbi:hypothetical protein Tco_0914197 [Tanacetum coccineum]